MHISSFLKCKYKCIRNTHNIFVCFIISSAFNGNNLPKFISNWKYNALAFDVIFYAKFFLVIRAVKKFGEALGSAQDYIEEFNYFSVALDKIGKDGVVEEFDDLLHKYQHITNMSDRRINKLCILLNSQINKLKKLINN